MTSEPKPRRDRNISPLVSSRCGGDPKLQNLRCHSRMQLQLVRDCVLNLVECCTGTKSTGIAFSKLYGCVRNTELNLANCAILPAVLRLYRVVFANLPIWGTVPAGTFGAGTLPRSPMRISIRRLAAGYLNSAKRDVPACRPIPQYSYVLC